MKKLIDIALMSIPAAALCWIAASIMDVWAWQCYGGTQSAWNIFNILMK